MYATLAFVVFASLSRVRVVGWLALALLLHQHALSGVTCAAVCYTLSSFITATTGKRAMICV